MFCGSSIALKTKAGKSVTLSSTEAEYYVKSEISKYVIYNGIQIQFLINIKCDNVGAIHLANNHCNIQRTKQIDTQQYFVCT
jgi:hypothetical protein